MAPTPVPHSLVRKRTYFGVALIFLVTLLGTLLTLPVAADLGTLEEMIEWRTPELTQVMLSFTWLFDPLRATVLALGVGVLVAWWCRDWKHGLFVTGSVGLSAAVTHLIKSLHDRERPPELLRLAVEHSPSFPSGHTTAATALFVSVALVITWRTTSRRVITTAWVLAALAIIAIALTRLYLAVHWFTDIIGGVCVGLGTVLILSPLLLAAQAASAVRSASDRDKVEG